MATGEVYDITELVEKGGKNFSLQEYVSKRITTLESQTEEETTKRTQEKRIRGRADIKWD
jgi:hypothetical protein